jgi:hypothetical protein
MNHVSLYPSTCRHISAAGPAEGVNRTAGRAVAVCATGEGRWNRNWEASHHFRLGAQIAAHFSQA